VSIPARRHDRPVGRGWGWSGSLYQRERFFVAPGLCDKRGYWAEQILSSSLFRLYRALGGDSATATQSGTTTDVGARAAAAHHSVFLIMKAIALIGPAAVVPALLPEDFVDALMQADIGTESFGGDPFTRFGGMARKVIRWSFQQQGLYNAAAAVPKNQPGGYELVDLHIASQRPDPAGGIYAPVDFADASWHAAPEALWLQTPGNPKPLKNASANKNVEVHVEVRNLGSVRAQSVDVELKWAPAPGGVVPDYDGAWTSIGKRNGSVAAGSRQAFGPFQWRPGAAGEYALMAIASSEDDRANIDPASMLPCALTTDPISTAHLVAWDNNLGVRVVTVS
jgi:hypothetical protein